MKHEINGIVNEKNSIGCFSWIILRIEHIDFLQERILFELYSYKHLEKHMTENELLRRKCVK